MDIRLISPCGMNCGICLAYLRDKNVCGGCWSSSEQKRYHCVMCSIMNCEFLQKTDSKFCYECLKFPCTRLKQLDKRYRLKYSMSMLENLHYIKKFGPESFQQMESVRWRCSTCGGTVCVHLGYCLKCYPDFKYEVTSGQPVSKRSYPDY